MKNLYFTVLALFSIVSVQAQQFSFNLYISDSLGHSDTLVFGYDITATDSIDAAFGEANIRSQAWDSIFEARICPLGGFYTNTAFVPSFETKKQIMSFNPQPPYNPYSYNGSSPFLVEIRSNMQRPYMLSWDSTLFADSALYSSYLKPVNPSFSFESVLWLSAQNSFVFQDEWMSNKSYYISNNDTVWVLAFQFVSYSTVGLEPIVLNDNAIKVYPNPAIDYINFDLKNIIQKSELIVYNSLGQLVKQESVIKAQQSAQLNISDLVSGIYYYHIIGYDKAVQYSGKFVK